MRMVDVCAFYTPLGGGVRTYIDQKLRAAPALGHEMIVIVPGARDEVVERGPGSIVVSLAAPTLPFDARYRYFNDETRLHRELDRWRPDHVDASSPWSSATMVGRWQGRGTRALVLHSDPLASYAYRWLGGVLPQDAIDRIFGRFWRHLRSLDGVFDAIVTPSQYYAERLAAGGLGAAKAVPLGVEPGRFAPHLRDEVFRRGLLADLGLPPSAALLVGVGRLSPEKRWKMVVRAVAEASVRQPIGLLIAGSGPQQAKLERMCRGHPNIRMLSHVTERDELARLLASCDALIHGCESETFGLAVSEARASGIPLIVPDRGAVAEQLAEGAGLAYRAASGRELASAVLSFLESGSDRQRVAAARHSCVRSLDDHFSELFDYYATIRARPRRLATAQENEVAAQDEPDLIGAPAMGH